MVQRGLWGTFGTCPVKDGHVTNVSHNPFSRFAHGDLDQAIEILQRTLDVLLIHGERTDGMVRIRMILAQGEKTPFQPFDM
jgi:hypothetical protein